MAKTLVAGLVALGSVDVAAEPPGSPQQPPALVVFVCEHGNVKSLMAASYFNQLAKERRLPFRGVARASAPDSTTVPPPIASALDAEGFEVSDFHPTAVSAAEISASVRVITIGTTLPSAADADASRVEQWNDVPPASKDYAAASDSLKAHVRDLIERVESRSAREGQ